MSAVYAHIGHDGSILYIGRTWHIEKRTKSHKTSSAWWPQVAHVTVLHDGVTHDEARRLERQEIEAHEPPHNFVFTRAWRELHAADRDLVVTRPFTLEEIAAVLAAYAAPLEAAS